MSPMSAETHASHTWHFLTNHTQVLLCIARTPDIKLREVADRVGITERAAQRIVADLVDAGYVDRRRQGRRNDYRIHPRNLDAPPRARRTRNPEPAQPARRKA